MKDLGNPLPGTEEEGGAANGVEENGTVKLEMVCQETQTDVLFPMPYEHLFLAIYSSINESDKDDSPGNNPMDVVMPDEYEVLNRSVKRNIMKKLCLV